MSDDVRPVGGPGGADMRVGERRDRDRRRTDRGPRASSGEGRALVPVVTEAATQPRATHEPEIGGSSSAFAAQLIGQGGQKRGIKGGPPVMDAARSTYLNAEYSGPTDRRPPKGRDQDTDI